MLDTSLRSFVSASLALVVMPGPDTVYVLSRGVSRGRTVEPVSSAGRASREANPGAPTFVVSAGLVAGA